MRKTQLSFWPLKGGEQGLGNAALLDQPFTAFFSSRQCPGSAIRAAMNWAVEQARGRHPVISGFHSPLDQPLLSLNAQPLPYPARKAFSRLASSASVRKLKWDSLFFAERRPLFSRQSWIKRSIRRSGKSTISCMACLALS